MQSYKIHCDLKDNNRRGNYMQIEKTYNKKELTLAIEGRVDAISSKELETEIIIATGDFDSLILDFDNVNYISSAGLRVLISTANRLKRDNIPFVIKNTNDIVKQIFKETGFDKILTIE